MVSQTNVISPMQNGLTATWSSSSSQQPMLSRRTRIARFVKKYFCEGQKFNESDSENHEIIVPDDADWFERLSLTHRKLIAFCIPPIFFWMVWWTLAISRNFFPLYLTRYELPIIMAFGSFIGGMTCEGSGAVAFPIMTLLLHIDPKIARDFALMIQSCGMTSASFTILYMGVALEWHSIIFCSVGSTFGIVIGIEFVDPLLSKDQKKMFFVSIWFAFACALFLLNTQKKRKTYLQIQNFNWWKAILLVATGFIGGVLTSFAGTGVCICSFSILTLIFSVSEKIATQTSIILMAGNALVGFFWRAKIQQTITELAWEYWYCTVPVSVIVGPLGAFVGSHVHRQTLAWTVYILELIALVGGFVIVKPNWTLAGICIGIVIGGFAFFFCLSRFGLHLLTTYKDYQKPSGDSTVEDGTIRRIRNYLSLSSANVTASNDGDKERNS